MKDWKENKKALFGIGCLGIVILIVLGTLICKFVLKAGNDRNSITASVNYEKGYESLKALNDSSYEEMSVKEFNDHIMQQFAGKPYNFQEAMQVVKDKVNDDDEESRFIKKTLTASLSELYQDKKTPYLPFSMNVRYTDFKEGSKDVKVTGAVYYEIHDAEKIRVAYRDETLEKLVVKVENCASQMFLPDFTKESIRNEIQSYFTEWQNQFSNEIVTFRLGITDVEIQ